MAAGYENVEVRDGGAWKTATAIEVKDGGTWKEAEEIWVKDGGTWKQSYKKSDPVVYTQYPTDSDSYRPSGWRGGFNIYTGSWGAGDHFGVMAFDHDLIASRLAVRPSVLSASIRLTRSTTVHGYNPGYGAYFFPLDFAETNASHLLIKSGQPSYSVPVGWSQSNSHTIYRGDTEVFGLDARIFSASGLAGLVIYDGVYPLQSDGGENNTYCIYDPFNTGVATRPLLTYTLDYSGGHGT